MENYKWHIYVMQMFPLWDHKPVQAVQLQQAPKNDAYKRCMICLFKSGKCNSTTQMDVILLYSRKPNIFPSITDHNLLNIFVIPKFMFPSLAFHGFYITQGSNSLIVPSSCEKGSYERTGKWRTVLLQDKILLRQFFIVIL